MSRSLFVVLEDPDVLRGLVPFGSETPLQMDPRREGLVCGSNLPRRVAELSKLARDLSLEPLDSFVRTSRANLEVSLELAEDAADEQRVAELRRQLENPPTFAAEAGLGTVESLVSFLLGHPEELGDRDETWWVVWDLRAIELVLRAAVGTEVRFALEEG